MHRTPIIACAFLFSLLFQAANLALAAETNEEGFTQLFNGETLDGWHLENGARFVVEDGVIKHRGGLGWLRSDKQYSDFVLRLEFRFLKPKQDGGVFLRSNTDGNNWEWETAPDAWEPGDYRAPTCSTCHMSGICELSVTHNVSERLYWNLWAKESKVRGSDDVLSPLLGDGPAGREKMKSVCRICHSTLHTDGFFAQGDKAVKLYNVAYYEPATELLESLRTQNLLGKNPWADEFQITYYHLWHHEGRRARQGAMMGAPDYAHWHGFFELQQALYKLEKIYEKRMASGEID